MAYKRLTRVDLYMETDTFHKLREQLDDQKKLLSLPSRLTERDYLLDHIIPLGMEEAERRMNAAKAPHIVVP